jgi:hypothetical protein
MKDVFAIFETKDGRDRSRWVRVGVAFDNKDGSLNVLLDAVPLSGRLQVRPRATESQPTAGAPDGVPSEPGPPSGAR